MSLIEELLSSLSGNEVSAMAGRVGAKENQVSNAIQAALPLVLGALNRNTNDRRGAQSLAGALERDHDGSILNDIMGFLNQGPSSRDMRITDHLFGNRREAVANSIGKKSGLDAGNVMQLLGMLAPIVLGALGKQKRQQGLDASALGNLLTGETERVRRKDPGAMGMVERFLDSDGDGDITDDVLNIGGSLLGGLFGNKR